MNLTIPIKAGPEPLYRQVYAGLRAAILSGVLKAGERLPSTRALSEQLAISRTVILLAYEQLLAEGFVVGRGGSGTYVVDGLETTGPAPPAHAAEIRLSRYGAFAQAASATVGFPIRPATSPRYDFAYGRGEVATFPFEMWQRLLLKHARGMSARGLDYAPPQGAQALREAIAIHLQRSRRVNCDASQVIVVSGSQQALDIIARVLIEVGDVVAIEDPQYQGTREILRAAGAVLRPSPVDREGLDPERLGRDTRVAFVTPSHQFPTGATLPLRRRLALLAWAAKADGVIVEDDYDGEFRYDGQPLESLQGLDHDGRVIYVGTFSRTIFSALRIGYLVAPRPMVDAFVGAKWLSDRHTATLEQQTLAEFISSGIYERYLRRVRRSNAARRAALVSAVARHLPATIRISGDGAGAHVVLWLPPDASENTAVESAAARGVGVYGLSRYYIEKPCPGLMLGYSQLSVDDIGAGIARLGDALRALA
jgi:GntR family transcriptional regulator/MocR family aminotransferase